jgi:hypothetical protein
MTPRPLTLLAGALVLVGLACGRSFRAPSVQPTVSKVVPEAAFGGQEVTIEGTHFDPSPDSNSVAFPGGTARGIGFDDAGQLQVRVPTHSAAPGTVTVTTPAGVSAPGGQFTYRGPGHPLLGSTLSEVPLLHRGRGIAFAAGQLFLPSSTFRGVVSPNQELISLPSRPTGFGSTPDGSALFLGYDADRAREKKVSASVSVVDPVTRMVVAKAPVVDVSARFVVAGPVSAATPYFFLVGEALDGSIDAVAFWPDASGDLVPVRTALPLSRALGAAASPDGSAVLVTGLGAPGQTLLAAYVDGGVSWLPVDGGVSGPIATATVAGAPRAAVAMEDGTVMLLDLRVDGGPPISAASSALGSAGGLAFTSLRDGGGLLLISHPTDGEVDAVDAATGASLWSALVGDEPTSVAIDADGGEVFVSSATRNEASRLDLFTGSFLGHVGFGLSLGNAPDCDCGAVTTRGSLDGGGGSTVFVLARASEVRSAVLIDAESLTVGDPVHLSADGGGPRGFVNGPGDSVWVLHDHALGRIPLVGGKYKREELAAALPRTPTQLAFGPQGQLLVGRAGGIDTFAKTVDASGAEVYVVAASTELSGTLGLLSARPDGGVVAVWSAEDAGNSVAAALWSTDALLAGGAPLALYPPDPNLRGLTGVLDLPQGVLVMFRSFQQGTVAQAIWLDQDLKASSPVPSLVKEPGPYLATPDQTEFVWARRILGDRTLRVDRAGDPTGGMVEAFFYSLSGPFGRPTFDPSGATMFIPQSSQDSVLVVQ